MNWHTVATTAAAPAAEAFRTAPDWVPAWLVSAWDLLAAYPLLLSLAIVVGGLLLAGIGRFIVLFWGLKLTSRTASSLDDDLVRLVARIMVNVVVMLSLIAAVESLPIGPRASQILTRLLTTLLILLLMNAGLRATHLGLTFLGRLRDRFRFVEERTIPLFDLGLTITVVSFAIYALLLVWNINPTAWLASAGVIGIAVGFAARDTLANLFAGFFIIADAPYKVGDYIVLDNSDRGECVSNETMSPVTAMRKCPLHGGAQHEGTCHFEQKRSPQGPCDGAGLQWYRDPCRSFQVHARQLQTGQAHLSALA